MIPVVAEELDIEIHRVVRGTVHVNKRVETHEEVVNIPAVTEEVVVERLPVNTVVEGDPPQIHEEGGVLLIPVLEEVVVVEKRLMLREVVRVTRRQIATTTSETVTLRREVVDVDRVEGEGRSHEKGYRCSRFQGVQGEIPMKTVIGLFEQKDEALRAYSQLLAEGYARADTDVLTNDDRDDEPKLAKMHSWVPEPDLDIYLAGVSDGGTIVTANVGDTAVARAAAILGSFNMVNFSARAAQLASKAPAAARAVAAATAAAAKSAAPAVPKQTPAKASGPPQAIGLTDPAKNDNVLEVIEEDSEVGKQQVERGRMRIYNVVTEREVAQNIALKDETLRVQRRPVSRAVASTPTSSRRARSR